MTDQLINISKKYDIHPDYLNKMWNLNEYHIVFVCDDSGSMNTRENGKSRWTELKETVVKAYEIASVFNPIGIDIHFLNRPTYFGVNDVRVIENSFSYNPSGCTPLITKLNEIKTQYSKTERNILLIIATDGEPSDGDCNTLEKLLDDIIKLKFNVTFLACTNDKNAIKYLDEIDRKFDKIDVIDDYDNEYEQIIKKNGKNYNFSYGDYIVKMLIGSLDRNEDSKDD